MPLVELSHTSTLAPDGFPTSPTPSVANSIRYHGRRRLVQAASFAAAILIPASGLMRIDPGAGALVVLDRQVWFADFFLIAGLWIMLASALIMLYSLAGTVFCGWVCPQNIVSEWANFVTKKFLGRRAKVELDGSAPSVAVTKDRALNWILLGLSLLGASLVVAIVPLFYFYPPSTVWSFVTWRSDPLLASSLHYIYFVFVLIIFLDVAFIRHFWCRFACVYRVWQHSFRTRETLHVEYDASRSASCSKCSYCVSSCFIEIDPRKTIVYDSCINCGECVDACNRLHQKSGEAGLLSFAFGESLQKKRRARAFVTTQPHSPHEPGGSWPWRYSGLPSSPGASIPGSRCTSLSTALKYSTSRAISITASRLRTSSTTRAR